jgi:type I restriction enzyme, R subunit
MTLMEMINMGNESSARIKINKLLEQAGWQFEDQAHFKSNIVLEPHLYFDKNKQRGFADYVLLDNQNQPLVVIEAKRPQKNPLDGKEQARFYAQKLNARFVILSNGELHYLWDIKFGNPLMIKEFPTLMYLTYQTEFNPYYKQLVAEKVTENYVAFSQLPNFENDPSYQNVNTRQTFISENKLKILRSYQVQAIQALQFHAKEKKNRFLFEMATGTGKTLTTAAVIKLFLKTQNVKRVLFLVDRIELENQASKSFNEQLKNDYKTIIYKENKRDWEKAEIVITTVQSLIKNNRYETDFKPTDFDLIISDEAHRSINGIARNVFEYFIGFKLGLTATPKDYLKNFSADPNNPLEIERRSLLDTYQIFGCEQGDPTFRYALLDGVRDGYLINPKVVDARTEITTRLLSEKGYAFQQTTDTEDIDEVFSGKDFEKTFFSDMTNRLFCEAFLMHALKDPINGEIGKTIVFCVSQNHASKITQILNELAFELYPDKYHSDFAMQVTSRIPNAQKMASEFAYNSLGGNSQFLEGYKTSKTRVCVTVGMMTTGYDCEDILNICFMRPIFSPTDFIQMKGRGTRPYLFKSLDEKTQIKKENFKLFDFFANYEYFEDKFNYDQILKLPSIRNNSLSSNQAPQNADKIIIKSDDYLTHFKETPIGLEGMKIDRQLFQKAKQIIGNDLDIKNFVEQQQWDNALQTLQDKYENKPDLYLTLEKLKRSENVNRRITWREVLERIFGLIDHFMNKEEIFDLDMEKLSQHYQPTPEQMRLIRHYVWAYLNDGYFKEIIKKGTIGELNTYSGFTVNEFRKLGEYTTILPTYIAEKIDLNNYLE